MIKIKSTMNRLILTVFLLALLPTAARAITAEALYSAYEANEVAADQQYKGKVISITGKVKTVGKDLLKNSYVSLETSNMILSVQCFFSEKDTAALAKLSKGDTVTITGTVKGSTMNIVVEDCKLK